LGYVDKDYSNLEGVAAFFSNNFRVMISNFKKHPTGPTAIYKLNGKVKLLIYDDQGKVIKKLLTANSIPVFRKNVELPDSKN